jgi:hypothetical protein
MAGAVAGWEKGGEDPARDMSVICPRYFSSTGYESLSPNKGLGI